MGLPITKKQLTPEQIVDILRESDSIGIQETCRKHGSADATRYRWKQMCGGMQTPEVQRIKALKKGSLFYRASSGILQLRAETSYG